MTDVKTVVSQLIENDEDDLLGLGEIETTLPVLLQRAGFDQKSPTNWSYPINRWMEADVTWTDDGLWHGAIMFSTVGSIDEFTGNDVEMARWLESKENWPKGAFSDWNKYRAAALGQSIRESDEDDIDNIAFDDISPEVEVERWMFTDYELKHPEHALNSRDIFEADVGTDLRVRVWRNGEVQNEWEDGTVGVPDDLRELASEVEWYVKRNRYYSTDTDDRVADNWRDVYVNYSGYFMGFVKPERIKENEDAEANDLDWKDITPFPAFSVNDHVVWNNHVCAVIEVRHPAERGEYVAVCTANGDIFSPVSPRQLRPATPEEIKSFYDLINQRVELLMVDESDEGDDEDLRSVSSSLELQLPHFGYERCESAYAEGFDFNGPGWIRRLPDAKVFISEPNAIGERTLLFRADGSELWRKTMTDDGVMDVLDRVGRRTEESTEGDDTDFDTKEVEPELPALPFDRKLTLNNVLDIFPEIVADYPKARLTVANDNHIVLHVGNTRETTKYQAYRAERNGSSGNYQLTPIGVFNDYIEALNVCFPGVSDKKVNYHAKRRKSPHRRSQAG